MHSLLLDTTMMVSSPSTILKSQCHKRSKSTFVGTSMSSLSTSEPTTPPLPEDSALVSPVSHQICGIPDVANNSSEASSSPPAIQVLSRTSLTFPSPSSMPSHLFMPTLEDLEAPLGRDTEEDDEVAFHTTSRFNLLPRMLPLLPLVDSPPNDTLQSY